ncbi:TonB-dependent receptor plug domain-containing protein [Pedobacter petrophilus]|uniref:TonB-dependent receptor plug domain-containing protein n=1 Tax=Pedobacter petrophilus TaxID=1908241 RepID=A0A7K0FZH6_9SPHI|nr:TonB-dependent receptor plug domain-containing protein [Pedobacter petrophilus]MRX76915.1 TonB-dependent receptor plug domain-containing protein [Pedobacter petrophilus]
MKKMLLMALTLALAFQSKAQITDSVKTSPLIIQRTPNQKAMEPLIVIDGNKQYLRGLDAASGISPQNIESVNVLKDSSATKKYGTEGLNGVIEIKTKNVPVGIYNKEIDSNRLNINATVNGFKFQPGAKSTIIKRNLLEKDWDPKAKPLYVLNGQEVKSIDAIDPNNVESVTVLKDSAATSVYKEKGKNGVVIITTKVSMPNPEKN